MARRRFLLSPFTTVLSRGLFSQPYAASTPRLANPAQAGGEAVQTFYSDAAVAPGPGVEEKKAQNSSDSSRVYPRGSDRCVPPLHVEDKMKPSPRTEGEGQSCASASFVPA